MEDVGNMRLVDKGVNTLAYGGELSADHPGFTDAEYRGRRATLADVARTYVRGAPVPRAPYVDEEHDLWKTCSAELAARHERLACHEYQAATARLSLPDDHVPQLSEVSELLEPLTGFKYEPVPGLVSPWNFYGALRDGWFMSTQYIRHHSRPYYTPEPDVIHEVIGHANQLASPAFAALYRKVGDAVQRVRSDQAVEFLSRVFWFTVEFGVVREDGDIKAFGAGILSSFGELDAFRQADIRAFDIAAMGGQSYDITRYQPVLFAADSMDALFGEMHAFLDNYDDDSYARYAEAS
jgi:phenylalanine-4-hydroxylase